MKISIIGYSGAGKSTLADRLSKHYQIPKLHMDTLRFRPNWVMRANEEMTVDVQAFLSEHDNWVMDGNYSFAAYAKRMEQADQIIFLNFNRVRSLYRVIKRYWTYRGNFRDSSANGCIEKLDWAFLWWVLYYGRRKEAQNRYKWVCQTYKEKVTILKTQKDIDAFLSALQ